MNMKSNENLPYCNGTCPEGPSLIMVFEWHFNPDNQILYQENALVNVLCKMAVILCQPFSLWIKTVTNTQKMNHNGHGLGQYEVEKRSLMGLVTLVAISQTIILVP